ncbi:YMGG-like glycine zipper-containing protein [Croceicoccus naphthovorans]|uniref:YMGG-like Gly-zipper domain-containing protein n=1 Tax=Croceicoccus naphthovorans TaxID=1348774 RepID=A0A0G3XH91_9SPHN|nr:YMGG-like glycine zipper-containing protein [Croceicoccus naphthovorans]AKM10011.1 hypothetical protein AB433_08530 [Croceicoccus naphthovorans]MBB3991109.1 hypothetical protein [Croceicoccus naphthovorans]
MKTRMIAMPVMAAAALATAGCAENYAVEGAAAGAAAGAAVGAVTGADIGTAAAVGAAAGAAGGYFIDKNDGCDGYDRDGRLDDDCYGTYGYPVDPR